MSVGIPDVYYSDRGSRGRLQLTGRDRQSFLQGMVTNDVLALTPGTGRYAFLLDPTGHVLADVRVIAVEGYLLLDTEPGMASFVAETLDRYLIMEKCRITDVSAEIAAVFVGGASAATFLEAQFGLSDLGAWPEGTNATVAIDGVADTGLIAAVRWTARAGFEIYCPNAAKESLIAFLMAAGAEVIADERLESLRIEAGVPRFGIDIDSKVLAPETGQQARAISYRKGCYIGQEIVARIDARGHANRTFSGFLLDSDTLPGPGSTVEAEGREVGRVTSLTLPPTLGRPIAIGYLRNEFAAPGTEVSVAGQPAHVSTLPFKNTGENQ